MADDFITLKDLVAKHIKNGKIKVDYEPENYERVEVEKMRKVKVIENVDAAEFEKQVNEFYKEEIGKYSNDHKSEIFTYTNEDGKIVYGTMIEYTKSMEFSNL